MGTYVLLNLFVKRAHKRILERHAGSYGGYGLNTAQHDAPQKHFANLCADVIITIKKIQKMTTTMTIIATKKPAGTLGGTGSLAK